MTGISPAAPPPDSPHRRGAIRFVWQADAEARFTGVSPELVEIVGAMAGDIVGRTWEEIARSVVSDPGEVVSGLLKRRGTWSGRSLLWSIDNTGLQIPVEWAGMPIFGPSRDLVGFRGFGVLRCDAIREADTAPPTPAAAGDPPTPPAENWFAEIRGRVATQFAKLTSGSLGTDEPDQPADGAASSRSASGSPEPEGPPEPASRLTVAERSAFREIARALGARIEPGPPIEETGSTKEEQEADPSSASGTPPEGRGPEEIFLASGRDAGSAAARPTLEGPPEPEPEPEPDPELVFLRERLTLAEVDLESREARVRELEAVLDTATDGVVMIDEAGRILSLNRSAEALFGYEADEVVGEAITVLLAPESHIVALDYLDGLRPPGIGRLLNDGREAVGRVRQGGTIPLFMTMGPVRDGPRPKVCTVLRDITAFKKAEGELLAAKREAEAANAQKSDLLAKISHEIRTPLNAIIGFAEVMLEERFGPVGNERYKDYLKDVHTSGSHVISLVNDLLDLAKIEAGRMELSLTGVSLNDLVSASVSLLQPQAARERIVIRTSFAPKLPMVLADERSIRQIALNLVSNAITFTDPGGQVIVSTALTDHGEVAFRIRDTGIGMTEAELAAALEPFRQLATTRRRGGTGLGLPLTKALVEANHGALRIKSAPREGTLVEVLFSPAGVMAQ